MILDLCKCKCYLFKGNPKQTLPKLARKLPKMDLIYIDGGHDYQTVQSDWGNAKKIMHEKTVVIFDDYSLYEGVRRVVDEITDYKVCIQGNFAIVNK